MKKNLLYFLKYYLFWIVFFLFFKILFLLYHFPFTKSCHFQDIVGIFRYGMVMDMATAAYLSFLPAVILLFLAFFKAKPIFNIIRYYTVFMLIACTFFGLLDLVLYAEWGTRLDNQILPALINPRGMLACVNWWQLILFLVLMTGIPLLFARFYRVVFSFKKLIAYSAKWYFSVIMLIITAFLFIPMRGGLSISPLNFSRVYFSNTLFINHAACNPYWSFIYALTHTDKNVKNLDFMTDAEAQEIVHRICAPDTSFIPSYIKAKDGKPVNVILIILESFSNKLIAPLQGAADLTPHLNELAKEGILFSSFYATGNRSDKGLSSLLASYPAVIGNYSAVYYPNKLTHLDFLSTPFKEHHYKTAFYYGGNIHFYNTKSLVLQMGIEHVISDADFDNAVATLQKWGVPDAYLYEKAYQDLKVAQEPFFTTIYTISSHSPYDIPAFEKHADKFLNSVIYADSCLGHFINQLKESPMWGHTLVIITSDHGTLGTPLHTTTEEPTSYRIPMLWIGGAVDTVFTHPTIGMQTDLLTTLTQQMGWKFSPSTCFSKNLFGKSAFAFYLNTKGYGFVSEQCTFFQDMETNSIKNFYPESPLQDSLLVFPKAFVQYVHDDFKKRGKEREYSVGIKTP